MNKIKFCCENLSEHTSELEKRGLFVVPQQPDKSDLFYFAILFKNYDNNYLEEVGQKLMQTVTAIKYCPWCGSQLQKLFNENRKGIQELFEHNTPLLILPPVRTDNK